MSPCPPPETWQNYVRGLLGPAEDRLLTEHVPGCPACEETLARLAPPCFPARPAAPAGFPPPAELVERLRRLWSARFPAEDLTAPECWPQVDGYEILGVLGRGGMGVVYRARQVALDRPVALKMIAAGERSSPADVGRLLNDAATAAQLRHEGIVPVHAVGQYRGLPYCVMELIAGGGLDQRLADLVHEPRETARLLAAAARALHHAHLHGVCHRDVKPANILLRVRGGEHPAGDLGPNGTPAPPRPRLCDLDACVSDFGLAKRARDEAGLTLDGAVVGTPGYAAPEQIRSERPAPTADVYGLGAVLYQCLTGQPPAQAATPFDTLLLTLYKEPERPRFLNSRLPRDLETICLKCLEKAPQRRYPSAAAVADDLERWLRGEPVRARPVGPLARAWRWCRRKPVLAALVVALLVPVVGGLAVSLGLWRRAVADESRALAGEANALENVRREEAAREDAEDDFTMIRQLLDEDVRVSDTPSLQAPAAGPERVALLLKAEACYTRLLQKRPQDQGLRMLLAFVLDHLGAYYFNAGQKTESLTCLEKAAGLFEQPPPAGTREPDYLRAGVLAYLHLGQAYERQGCPGPARQAFETSLRLWEAFGRAPPSLDNENDAFYVGLDVGCGLIEDDRSDEDIRRRFESLCGRPGLLGGTEPYELFLDLLRAELLHGRASRTGQSAAVLAGARAAAAVLEPHLRHAPPDRSCRLALARYSLLVSRRLRKGGAPEEALRLAEPANRTLQALAREAPETGFLFTVLGSSWSEVGKIRWELQQTEETLDAYRSDREAQRRALALAPGREEYRQELGRCCLRLARKLCELGRLDEAEACLRERQGLWPGNAAKHAEALREVRRWAAQVGGAKKDLSPPKQRERERYLDFGTRLEERNSAASAARGEEW